jgi:hypothetical protein
VSADPHPVTLLREYGWPVSPLRPPQRDDEQLREQQLVRLLGLQPASAEELWAGDQVPQLAPQSLERAARLYQRLEFYREWFQPAASFRFSLPQFVEGWRVAARPPPRVLLWPAEAPAVPAAPVVPPQLPALPSPPSSAERARGRDAPLPERTPSAPERTPSPPPRSGPQPQPEESRRPSAHGRTDSEEDTAVSGRSQRRHHELERRHRRRESGARAERGSGGGHSPLHKRQRPRRSRD